MIVSIEKLKKKILSARKKKKIDLIEFITAMGTVDQFVAVYNKYKKEKK